MYYFFDEKSITPTYRNLKKKVKKTVDGKKIRALREALGLRTTEVSAKVGISQPQYTYIENELKIPSVTHLVRIANCLGVPVGELIKQQERN